MVNGTKLGVGLLLLFVGLWSTNFLSMIPVIGNLLGGIFGFLPAFPITLPEIIPGIPIGLIIFLIGLAVTAWGATTPY
ncbi:MAG: hypothetical protein KAT35_04650 [Candidatus Aenigmarchaeota archaeon]|nr:hypothetical protein [Candidatus Aenigmarchaeota archaeon]